MIFYICRHCKKSLLITTNGHIAIPPVCSGCGKDAVIDNLFGHECVISIPIQVGDSTWPPPGDILFEKSYKKIALQILDFVYSTISEKTGKETTDPVVVNASFEKGILSFNIKSGTVLSPTELGLITTFVREKLDDSLYYYRKSIKG